MPRSLSAALLLAAILSACTSIPDYPNKPLAAGSANAPSASPLDPDPNAPLILIAFSGGGSRAAALGLGVLDQLADTSYLAPAGPQSLVDHVRVVSSVSGGSVVAGWFALVGPKRMDELKDRFLARDNMATLEWQAAEPVTWARLAFSSFTRIDALRDLLDRELFDHARFADLYRPGAPILLMNATDMEAGEVFAFTPARFDDLCSDLDQLPLSVGVSASAAFPVALSPMSLRNYSYEGCQGKIPGGGWIEAELGLPLPRYINLEEYKRARYAHALRNGQGAYRNEHYLHLLDGGLADNQGIHSLMDALVAPHSQTQILGGINDGKVKRIVVISVNARSDSDNHIGSDEAVPGLLKVLSTVIGTPIDATTAYANTSMNDLTDALQSAGSTNAGQPGHPLFAGLRVYKVAIDFDQFSPDQSALETDVKNISTSWNLSPQALEESVRAGRMLLQQHPCFERLMVDLGVAGAAGTYPAARQSCPFEGD
ncbi:MAG TPA: patatin-like phospholipase family protein [Aliidongia sp.]|nr:patatin-like phospholipase family protein [Aliidongia sp.]